jgi:hypothetical protein
MPSRVLVSLLLVLDEALASEDTEVRQVWLVAREKLVRGLVMEWTEKEPVDDVYGGGDGFSPKVVG